ncbi:MAG: 4Fe-4S dicluster domain-containing protein [candidate division Zixibacteria bacterium]|nr:4Fe-4S dicluster domain-containing protein [candidate division Zixibacteria bacterium]
MEKKRREFLKVIAAGTSGLIGGSALASESSSKKDTGSYLGVLVDTVNCIGCRKCEWACNQENQEEKLELAKFESKEVFKTSRRMESDKFTVVNSYDNPKAPEEKSFLKVQCMHCNEPACVSACIVGALTKSENGAVSYDAWKCIGCRYCIVACPFQVPTYEYHDVLTPEVKKCTFCYHLIKEGKAPACVEICPEEALTFGTRKDLIELAYSRIKKSPDKYYPYIYGEKDIGGTSWMYLTGVNYNKTQLPELPERPIPEITESIQHGIFKSFIPPLALYGLLGLIMYSTKEKENSEGGENE